MSSSAVLADEGATSYNLLERLGIGKSAPVCRSGSPPVGNVFRDIGAGIRSIAGASGQNGPLTSDITETYCHLGAALHSQSLAALSDLRAQFEARLQAIASHNQEISTDTQSRISKSLLPFGDYELNRRPVEGGEREKCRLEDAADQIKSVFRQLTYKAGDLSREEEMAKVEEQQALEILGGQHAGSSAREIEKERDEELKALAAEADRLLDQAKARIETVEDEYNRKNDEFISQQILSLQSLQRMRGGGDRHP